MSRLRCWYYALRSIRNHARDIARRVEVEQYLLDVANGKAEIPSRATCRLLAFKLAGVKV